MKIAVIFTPYTHKLFAENLKVVDNRFGVFPPLHLLYLTAFLKKAGHSVIFIDAHAANLSPEKCFDKIRKFGADMLCFNMTTYMFYDTLKWIRFFKSKLDIPVLVGGINLLLYPYETMSHPEIDYAVIGEASPTALDFLSAYENNVSFENIKGLCYRTDGIAHINPLEKYHVDFESYPFPAREGLNNELYFEHISRRKNFTIALTSTGCPYRCTFCAIPGKPYSCRSMENVLSEVDECYNKHSIREIDYFDAVFTFDKDRSSLFCEGLLKREYDLSWSCRIHVNNIDRDLIRLMASSGCSRIYFGIETSDEGILKRMRKNISLENVENIVGLCHEFSIRPLGFFMIGNPGDTRKAVAQTIRFAKRVRLNYAQFSRTIAKPQSKLNDELIETTKTDYWREYIAGKKEEMRLPSPWTELTEEEIEHLTWRAYISFYFTPRVIFNALKGFKSLDEILRYIRVAVSMLMNKKEKGVKPR